VCSLFIQYTLRARADKATSLDNILLQKSPQTPEAESTDGTRAAALSSNEIVEGLSCLSCRRLIADGDTADNVGLPPDFASKEKVRRVILCSGKVRRPTGSFIILRGPT
jgi:hypothetical protein